MKVKLAVFMMLFTFSILVNSVCADWNLVKKTGEWQQCERTYWQTPWGDNSGEAEWVINIANFTRYDADFRPLKIDTYRSEWWHFNSWKDLRIYIEVSDVNKTFCINAQINLVAEIQWWGLYYNRQYYVYLFGVNKTCDTSKVFSLEYYPTTYITLNLFYNASQNRLYGYIYHVTDTQRKWVTILYDEHLEDGVEVPSGWGQNVTIKIRVQHNGKGDVKAEMVDTVNPPGPPPSFPGTEELIAHDIWNWITQISGTFAPWIKGILNMFAIVTMMLATVIGVFWHFAGFIPFIILFWFLDAALTSIHEGNLYPLGNVFMTLYDFVRAVIQTIITILHYIYNVACSVWDKIKEFFGGI